MLTLHQPHNPTTTTSENAKRCDEPISAERVKYLLREIAYALHTTRVVGRRGPIAPKKG